MVEGDTKSRLARRFQTGLVLLLPLVAAAGLAHCSSDPSGDGSDAGTGGDSATSTDSSTTKDGSTTTDGGSDSATTTDSGTDSGKDGGGTGDGGGDGGGNGDGGDGGAAALKFYAIGGDSTLLSFTAATLATPTSTPITGLANDEVVVGIDFRPSDGKLYAVGSTSRIYTVTTAGVATAVSATPFDPALSGASFGVDFNPVADRLRVHSDTGQNHRLNPNTGANAVVGDAGPITDTPLTYADGGTPSFSATAYSNSVVPAPSSTTIYAIDFMNDSLATLASPNNGIATVVGALGVDFGSASGFDIHGGTSATPDGGSPTVTTVEAYAVTNPAGATSPSLYRINLTTGAATLVGAVTYTGTFSGFAIGL
ncbi:MAG: DUF4394 domain-containing protein [Polyangiaceae bacterium]